MSFFKRRVQEIALLFYYIFAQWLPNGNFRIRWIGSLSRWLRAILCKKIFKRCGRNVNIQRRVYFGKGYGIELGDNSGIGSNSHIPPDTKIGNNVMIGPNLYILWSNHNIERIDVPMIKQGLAPNKQCIIENDVWIGRNVTMTPGRYIKSGSVIGACCVLTKDFPEYSIVGGNPSKLIRNRLNCSIK